MLLGALFLSQVPAGNEIIGAVVPQLAGIIPCAVVANGKRNVSKPVDCRYFYADYFQRSGCGDMPAD